jgi:hypothetical protein
MRKIVSSNLAVSDLFFGFLLLFCEVYDEKGMLYFFASEPYLYTPGVAYRIISYIHSRKF